MKWTAIAGGWRKTNEEIELKIKETVKRLIIAGNGIISGGALGVDYIATDEALRLGADKNTLKIFIPSSLEVYKAHYDNRAKEGVITEHQAKQIILQLRKVKNKGALIEGTETVLNNETYFNRITKMVEVADELIAFHINNTEGTRNTIDKANKKGIRVKVYTYTI